VLDFNLRYDIDLIYDGFMVFGGTEDLVTVQSYTSKESGTNI